MQDQDPAAARRNWMAVLARAPRESLEGHWNSVVDPPSFVLLKPPETGLVMVRARSGDTGAEFNLGEMTMTRCVVRSAEGAQGHAYIAGRALRKAEIAARFDALLQIADRREVLMARVIAPLAAAQEERRQRRWNDAVGTRVDFLTVVRG
jgi:alpha-D-ribose 1-methylphosphonate 5-triphosphate synthase subunit PhnG